MNKWIATLALPILALLAGLFVALAITTAVPQGVVPPMIEMPVFYFLVLSATIGIAWLLGFWRWGWSAGFYAIVVCILATWMVPILGLPLLYLLINKFT